MACNPLGALGGPRGTTSMLDEFVLQPMELEAATL
jgi:hypothetical protein